MKTIKSLEVNGTTITMADVNGIYFILVNDRPISNSTEFGYISSIFDKWVAEL
jgi:hypothetical protein